MRLYLIFDDTEAAALQRLAVRRTGSADERAIVYTVRALVRDCVIADGLLNQEESESEIVSRNLEWIDGSSISRPTSEFGGILRDNNKPPTMEQALSSFGQAAKSMADTLVPAIPPPTKKKKPVNPPSPRKAPKTKVSALNDPQKTFRKSQSNTYTLWLYTVKECLHEPQPVWFTFDTSMLANETGMTEKQVRSALETLRSSGWYEYSSKTSDWSFTSQAKANIHKRSEELRSLSSKESSLDM